MNLQLDNALNPADFEHPFNLILKDMQDKCIGLYESFQKEYPERLNFARCTSILWTAIS